jgi:uncharacterized protein with HEPN domain
MPHEAERYLFDIQSACVRIEIYTAGLDLEIYQRTDQVRDSVERGMEIIGEAVRKVILYHPDLSALFPDAHAIVGMRNILSHAYGEVNDAVVWSTTQERVPELLVRVTRELELRKRTSE